MKDFRDKLAVVTGGGSGIGLELARQLVSEGCHVAICDVLVENLREAEHAIQESALDGTRVTAHECDVADEAQVVRFHDSVLTQHDTDHVHILFNNAGIAAGSSFFGDDREEWDRVFAVCWSGVYYCSRAFLPLLVASPEAYVVNICSLSGLVASFAVGMPASAYGTAKFAVRGFTESLITDLRLHAPHVKAAVVFCGPVGTSIGFNTSKILGWGLPEEMSSELLGKMRSRRERYGIAMEGVTDDEIRDSIRQFWERARDQAPVSAAEAATIILDGVRNEEWRIIVGEGSKLFDRRVRDHPGEVYEYSFWRQWE